MLLGIKPDYLIVKMQDEEVTIKDVIVGLYDGSLTKDGTYNSLISLELLEGREKHEFA